LLIEHACFISYCHGQKELMTRFIDELKHALESSIEPYLDEEVYIDVERLGPGYRYNEALAQAICRSVCMVTVLMPKYFSHDYCLRELAAMKRLEEQRFQTMGAMMRHGEGLIIPIILRGKRQDLPPEIRDHVHCCDFSRYSTAIAPRLSQNPDFQPEIDRIAEFIYGLYRRFQAAGDKIQLDCGAFSLPDAQEAQALFPLDLPDASPRPFQESDR